MCEKNSHCQSLGFTFYCIVNAGIFFVYYVYDYYICIFVYLFGFVGFVCFSS